jgi:hypothetical protein
MQKRQISAALKKKGKLVLKGFLYGSIHFLREPVVMIFEIQNRYSISVI